MRDLIFSIAIFHGLSAIVVIASVAIESCMPRRRVPVRFMVLDAPAHPVAAESVYSLQEAEVEPHYARAA
jgi:hypothetical protein